MSTADFVPVAAKLKEFGSLRDQLKICLDDSKKNLFEHLTKVMDHIVYHCP